MHEKTASELAAVSNVTPTKPIVVNAIVDTPFSPAGLSDPQLAVLRYVAQGQTLTEAAQNASVGRSTIYRWLADHPRFSEAHQCVQRQIRDYVQADLQALMVEAMQNVRSAILRGDARISIMLLKQLGMLISVK